MGQARGAAVSAAVVLAGALAAGAAPPPGFIDLSKARVVDLSHAFGEDTVYWPTAPSRFELKTLHHGPVPAGYFYSAYSFCTPEHGGTHLDAPVHFAEGRWSTDEVPLEPLIGPAAVITGSGGPLRAVALLPR